jgi:hypothetical protein
MRYMHHVLEVSNAVVVNATYSCKCDIFGFALNSLHTKALTTTAPVQYLYRGIHLLKCPYTYIHGLLKFIAR